MKELDIKWLQEYAEQEKKYKWGKQIKVLLKDYEDSQLEIEELKSRNQGKTEALEEWINGERVSIHCVHKNKIKEIIYPTPENPIPIEIQQSEMYKKLLKEMEE